MGGMVRLDVMEDQVGVQAEAEMRVREWKVGRNSIDDGGYYKR